MVTMSDQTTNAQAMAKETLANVRDEVLVARDNWGADPGNSELETAYFLAMSDLDHVLELNGIDPSSVDDIHNDEQLGLT